MTGNCGKCMENELSSLINLGLGEISMKFVEKKCCLLV